MYILAAEGTQHALQRVVATDLVIALGQHNHCRQLRDAPSYIPQHIKRGVVGPMHILDHQNGRPHRVGQLAKYRGEHRVPVPRGQGSHQRPAGMARDVLQWPQRARRHQVVTRPDQHSRRPSRAPDKSAHHAGLTNARFTTEQHNRSTALGPRQRRSQDGKLGLALEQATFHHSIVTAHDQASPGPGQTPSCAGGPPSDWVTVDGP